MLLHLISLKNIHEAEKRLISSRLPVGPHGAELQSGLLDFVSIELRGNDPDLVAAKLQILT